VFGAVRRTVNRVERRRKRRERAGRPPEDWQPKPRPRPDLVSVELDALFGPSRKHVHERKEWVAVAKIDDREAGDGPIDLDSGVVRLGNTSSD
jgi:hypothetical protein